MFLEVQKHMSTPSTSSTTSTTIVQPFALYEELEKIAASSNAGSSLDLNQVYGLINNLDEEQVEFLSALILHHALKTGVIKGMDKLEKEPDNKGKMEAAVEKIYSAKKTSTGKGRTITVKNLPEDLQKIIAAYLKWLQ